MGNTRLKRVNYTHDAMIDLLLQSPDARASELAEIFGYSEGWVCSIMLSDSFQARYAERKQALVSPLLTRSLNERLDSVAHRSLEVLEKKLQEAPSASLALETLGLAISGMGSARGSGFGAPKHG